jgi:hypothetical protein
MLGHAATIPVHDAYYLDAASVHPSPSLFLGNTLPPRRLRAATTCIGPSSAARSLLNEMPRDNVVCFF